MANLVWLEVAVNGPWSLRPQPHILVSEDEIVADAIACAETGTSIPIYRAMFTQYMVFGFPPTDWALVVYLRLMAIEAPGAPWMVAGLGVEIDSLIEMTMRRGGHLRVGLEDAPLGSDLTDLALVERARRRIEAAGGVLATTADMRAALKTV